LITLDFDLLASTSSVLNHVTVNNAFATFLYKPL
jgi:hypothetical protein